MKIRTVLQSVCNLSLASLISVAVVSGATVSTGQYDNYRSGTNTSETTLTQANVNSTSFGKIGSYAVDGVVAAQPLYVPALKINGTTTNILFIATMNNSVYAFDATKVGSAPMWKTTLAPAVPAVYTGQCPAYAYGSQMGITGTPVIDTTNDILYAIYATTSGSNTYAFYIAALNLLTGQQMTGSPTLISGSVPGTGYDNVGGTVTFNSSQQNQRTALTLAGGKVYAGFATCAGDLDPYHGWVFGYSASNVSEQKSILNTTPNGGEGGVWQSGRGFAVDPSGNLYMSTANGTIDSSDISESVVIRLDTTGKVSGTWTDPNATTLNDYDLELGSGGPIYVGSLGLLLAGGKEGVMHVLNPTEFGSTGGPLVQSFVATQQCTTYEDDGCYELFNSYVYWDTTANPLLYVWGQSDILRAYRYSGGVFNTKADSVGTMSPQTDAAALALSSNGSTASSAIVWAVTMDGYLHAYQATNVANELYNTGQNAARDGLGDPTHFIEPTVAGGQVYVATQDNVVQVYGLLSGGGSGTATASFVKADTSTQGSWVGVYGADGYSIEADETSNPTYAAPVVSGTSTYTWESSTTDTRGLQRAEDPSERLLATWYTGTSFTIDTGITDTNIHQVALYCIDWGSQSRTQTIQVLDDNNNFLDTETMTSFTNGTYMVWNVTGHVIFKVTYTGGANAVASAIFFGGGSSGTTAAAKFVTADTTTEGNWLSAYGADGYSIEADQTSNPSYATPAVSGASTYTWEATTTDVRGLQRAENPSERLLATWYSSTSFTIDSGITDTNQHQVALYCIDWGSQGRAQTIQVVDTNGNILDTESMTSFTNGTYMVWNVTGHVKFIVTLAGGVNAVVSAIFFGGASTTTTTTATFVKADTTTEGNWLSTYGADGYSIEADETLNPSYATPTITGASTYTWEASTTDARGLQRAENPSERLLAAWYSQTSFTIDSEITDQNQHQVALYCIDWGPQGRQQTIQVVDDNNNVLDTETMTSFANGTYMVWNVTGHVKFIVTLTAGVNAVVSGIFFGGPRSPVTPSATFVKADTTTEGSWVGVYGADGYSIEADQTLNPSYAAPVVTGASTYTWEASTTDVRGLQRAEDTSERLLATWYTGTSFTIDTGITDGNQHQVALYCIDWGSQSRAQTIQVVDTNGNVLDTESMTSFANGTYMVWNVTGHVEFIVTYNGGNNAVASAIFFGQ